MNEKRVALISGANKGLGFETARQLGKQGITVLIGARSEERGQEAVAKLKGEGIDARFVHLDVDDDKTHETTSKFIEENFGKLDILVNNAGVNFEFSSTSMPSPASETTLEMFRKTFETNFFSQIALTQKLMPLVKKSDAGRIVNVSSALGSNGYHSDPTSDYYQFKIPAYNASKTALNAYTVHLAFELKDTKIKVNAAHPGWVKTDLGTENAPMEVEDGAKTSVQLATLGADGITGGFVHLGEHLPW